MKQSILWHEGNLHSQTLQHNNKNLLKEFAVLRMTDLTAGIYTIWVSHHLFSPFFKGRQLL